MISYKVFDGNGLEIFMAPLSLAHTSIVTMMAQDDSKWLYINGKHIDIKDLTIRALASADSIILVEMLRGG
ncbi:MAG: hypothetical protein HOF96_08895 [Candidatus Marinimicrobia bacterium]|jgi:hypothetical protein|nr:hypothetical protein [Candidatus Neomarinimicrobiota bacterium]MBT3825084.1 hypothetical protein [Candidatus Neomarinimicrobiota bacterium]MBT5314236.1 hypothetical protein [Candidatus Neomarinimicrobiota bacterium]MBT6002223.1 hypothetical protein [Candidatus Neomarinimicrobiota bacterium]MBT6758529.1 hypothetical protein [Candidatus Neomarinimicrobiota bacterium]